MKYQRELNISPVNTESVVEKSSPVSKKNFSCHVEHSILSHPSLYLLGSTNSNLTN